MKLLLSIFPISTLTILQLVEKYGSDLDRGLARVNNLMNELNAPMVFFPLFPLSQKYLRFLSILSP